MKLGDRIRFFRIQQHKTQEELSSGIISVSYLSKIENNQSQPSEEVINLLCERLGIQFTEGEEANLLVEIMDWYKLIIGGNGTREEIEDLYKTLKQKVSESKHSNIVLHFTVFEFRYLIQFVSIEEAGSSLGKILEITDLFTEQLHYYFNKFKGLYEYVTQEYQRAYDHYQKAEHFLSRSVFEKLEEADLYYALGLTSAKLLKNSLCIKYTTLSLTIYQALYQYKRCAECQIMMAISYTNSAELDKAEECLLLAEKIVDTLSNSKVKDYLSGSIHHNLGYVYSCGKKLDEAIYHYKQSIEYKVKYNDQKTLSSIHSLLLLFNQKGDTTSALLWVKKGIEKLQDKDIEFFYHFKTWEYILNERTPEFEKFVKKKVIPYFIDTEDHEYVADYCEILATYYEDQRKYKQANHYLRMAASELRKAVPF
ncbi:helix-turn-helix domain-containing protein [Bacillus pinisoli]|uniref:helix-turn-helix domain-containing protein n=1 Tax=Bacillus pinisoli TaxID=2901866 RepID=UPI001FF5D4AB|nr:helix-turn-helix transcriptional regulator [Bacillus pinisoli]